MIKKRFFTSLVAIFTAVVMVFSLAGCQNGENNGISQKEFMQGVKKSYDNYVSAYKDYDAFGDITITASGTNYSSTDGEHTYTPEGASQSVTKKYTDSSSKTATATISVKKINNEIVLVAEYQLTEVDTEHVTTETTFEKVVTTSMERNRFEFGVIGTDYYAKAVYTEKYNDEQTEEKVYQKFADRASYVSAINKHLEELNDEFVFPTYSVFEGSQAEMLLMFPMTYSKDGNLFVIGMDVSMLMIDGDSKESHVMEMGSNMKYGPKGIAHYETNTDYGLVKAGIEMKFDYTSSNKALSGIEGYTEGVVNGAVIDGGILEILGA